MTHCMCIIIANKRNVTSAFQMKAATITKNSDRKRKNWNCVSFEGRIVGWKHRLCGVSTQKRFSLNSERDTFAPISDNFIKKCYVLIVQPRVFAKSCTFILKWYDLIELQFDLVILKFERLSVIGPCWDHREWIQFQLKSHVALFNDNSDSSFAK